MLSNPIYHAVLESLGEGVSLCDHEGRIIYVNQAGVRLTGLGTTDITPEEWSDYFGVFLPDGVTPFPAKELPLVLALQGQSTNDVEMIIRNHRLAQSSHLSVSGRPVESAAHDFVGAVVIYRDITGQKRDEAKLAEQAAELRELVLRDDLSGLWNRRGFDLMAKQRARYLERGGIPLSILFFDLDDFKIVNDSLGHLVGDQALQEFGSLLLGCVRQSEIVARRGGDEFVLLCMASEADLIAKRVTAALAERNMQPGATFQLSCSIGVATSADAQESIESVLARADADMYQHKLGKTR